MGEEPTQAGGGQQLVGGVVELVEPRIGAPGPEVNCGWLLDQVTVAAYQRNEHALAVQGLQLFIQQDGRPALATLVTEPGGGQQVALAERPGQLLQVCEPRTRQPGRRLLGRHRRPGWPCAGGYRQPPNGRRAWSGSARASTGRDRRGGRPG